MQGSFKTKMKIDVALLKYLMKISHLVEEIIILRYSVMIILIIKLNEMCNIHKVNLT